jgi:hypothetical protein
MILIYLPNLAGLMGTCKSPKIINTFRERKKGAQEEKSMKRNKGIKM